MGFLRSGVIRAYLNAEGKIPVWRYVLMMWVSAGTTAGEIAWRRWDGIGSSGQVVGWLERMSLEISASESVRFYISRAGLRANFHVIVQTRGGRSPYFYILDIHELVMKKIAALVETTRFRAATKKGSMVFRVSAAEGFCVQRHAQD